MIPESFSVYLTVRSVQELIPEPDSTANLVLVKTTQRPGWGPTRWQGGDCSLYIVLGAAFAPRAGDRLRVTVEHLSDIAEEPAGVRRESDTGGE